MIGQARRGRSVSGTHDPLVWYLYHVTIAIPGADDLVELREAVQGERVERDRVERTVELFAPRFALERHERVQHVVTLDRESIEDVLTSTYRGLRHSEQERLQALGTMDVTLARDLLLFTPAR